MPRGMDERFEDPSDEKEQSVTNNDETAEEEAKPEGQDDEATTESEERSVDESAPTDGSESPSEKPDETDDGPLNIREDWDSATMYVEPEQSEDIEITFTRLKKQLKREGVTLEKNKHFYRGVFEVAFGEHREETKKEIRKLAKQDTD